MASSKYDHYTFPITSDEPGTLGNLSEEQEAALNDMRSQLEEADYNERLDSLTLVGVQHYYLRDRG